MATVAQDGEGEWLLLSNDDVTEDDHETETCGQLLLDVRFEPDAGKYTLPAVLGCRTNVHSNCVVVEQTKSKIDLKLLSASVHMKG